MVLVALVVLPVAGSSIGSPLGALTFQVTNTPEAESDVVLFNDGDSWLVAYVAEAEGWGRVYYQRLGDDGLFGDPVPVSAAEMDARSVDAHEDVIVYTEHPGNSLSTEGVVVAHSVSTGWSVQVSDLAQLWTPVVHGDEVVWVQRLSKSSMALMRFDLSQMGTGASPEMLAGPAFAVSAPAIGSRYVAWQEGGKKEVEVYAHDRSDGSVFKVGPETWTAAFIPSTSGDWIAWLEWEGFGQGATRIEAWNPDTGERRIVVEDESDNLYPDLDLPHGLAYISDRDGSYSVYYHQWATGQTLRVNPEPYDQWMPPSTMDGWTAYLDVGPDQTDVYMGFLGVPDL